MSSESSSAPRVAILDDYQRVALTSADWSSLSNKTAITVFSDTLSSEDELVERLLPFHIICTMRERTKITATLIDRLPNLRLITTTGMKNASIDSEYAKKKGIPVCGTGVAGNSTLEHIWGLILATARRIAHEDHNIKAANKVWQHVVPMGLSGRTLGLIGVGGLGTQAGKIAKVFNMKVIGWSPHLTPERAAAAGVEFVATKEELMAKSDIISVHLVLSPTTRHIISGADLALMKPSALFINTSRGPLVNEEALVNVLRNRGIAGAGLDVYEVEPLPLAHPLRTLKNVTLTPHNGYVNDTMYEVFYTQTVENVTCFLEGGPKRLLA